MYLIKTEKSGKGTDLGLEWVHFYTSRLEAMLGDKRGLFHTCTPMFIASLFTIAKSWKQPKCPLTDEWIKEMWYIYTMEYYSAIKKNEIMPFAATWMPLEIIILSKISQKEEDKYNMISLICGI